MVVAKFATTTKHGAVEDKYQVKDHPFIDGCKRIATGIFLLYLRRNNLLNSREYIISNGALTAITLLVAESRPEEKEIMVRIIMNILFNKM